MSELNHRSQDSDIRKNIDIISFTKTINIQSSRFIISISSAFILVGAYAFAEPTYRELIEFATVALGLTTGFLTIIYNIESRVYLQKRLEYNQTKDRTIKYISRWDDSELYPLKNIAKTIIREAKKDNAKIMKYLEDTNKQEEKQAIICVLNFLEKVAYLTREGDVDEDKIRNYYQDIFIDFYNEFRGFIEDRKEEVGHNNKVYQSFEHIVRKWQK